jgi:hypothetical protein
MRSDSTLVPPVTAERSPPDSRMTGADSPVIADSSTLAMAVDDLAVAGDDLAGDHDARVADLELGAGHLLDGSVGPADVRERVRPGPAQRVGLGLAPPSAMASAKLANSTVNHSHSATSR